MNKVDQTYDRPREKAKIKGVAALSDVELLQLMIGSGYGKETVGKIARRTGRVLKRYGSGVTYQQLSALKGLGPARIAQLLAVFELASRYPVDDHRALLKTSEAKHLQLLKERPSIDQLIYLTLDGAGRLIRQRKRSYGTLSIETVIRTVCADAVADCATHLHIGRFTTERLLIPTLTDLSSAKTIAGIGELLGFTASYVLFNSQDWHSVTKDVSHV